mgnify:CR=1 FL=1|jgi:hypothetical protein|tara:strand:- start:1387 stop:2448 length:1062 start_codon:yes stop_codon:yes gene_type:complete
MKNILSTCIVISRKYNLNSCTLVRVAMAIMVVMAMVGCSTEPKSGAPKTEIKPVPKVEVPVFSADSAYGFIQKQVDFGPRVPNTEPHSKTAAWLASELERLGLTVETQTGQVYTYDDRALNIKNIIGKTNIENKNRVLLFAHWDTRHLADRGDDENYNTPIDGANDGASGVGVILELLRTINASKTKPNVGLDVVFFDAEDHGYPEKSDLPYKEDSWCLGTQFWANSEPYKTATKPKFGILLDMVGAADAVFPQEAVSLGYARQTVNKIWSQAARLGYSSYFTGQVIEGGLTDDHLYVNRMVQVPSVDIIHYDLSRGSFGEFHHTVNDNMSIIHKPTLQVVGNVVLNVIYNQR